MHYATPDRGCSQGIYEAGIGFLIETREALIEDGRGGDQQFKADELSGFLFELGELDLLDTEWKDSRFRATVERNHFVMKSDFVGIIRMDFILQSTISLTFTWICRK